MRVAVRTCVSFANFSQVGEPRHEVAAGLDTAEVDVVAVGADDVLALAERLVREHLDRGPDGADRAAPRAEGLTDLLLFGWPEIFTQSLKQLHFVEAVVAAYQRQYDPPIGDDGHRLRSRTRVDAEKVRDVLDRALPRRLDLLGLRKLLGKVGLRGSTLGDLEICSVVAVLARYERVLARPGRREEVPAPATAHHPRLRPDLVGLEAATVEDALVRRCVLLEALVQSRRVAVERVAVLHDELANP